MSPRKGAIILDLAEFFRSSTQGPEVEDHEGFERDWAVPLFQIAEAVDWDRERAQCLIGAALYSVFTPSRFEDDLISPSAIVERALQLASAPPVKPRVFAGL